MGLEADRMANLVLTDAVVLPERDVILEERRQRIENNPAAKLGEMADAIFYLNSPYREPTIGCLSSRALSTQWHGRSHRPSASGCRAPGRDPLPGPQFRSGSTRWRRT